MLTRPARPVDRAGPRSTANTPRGYAAWAGYAGTVTRRHTVRPMPAIVVLLLAFAVVAMHQMATGHGMAPIGSVTSAGHVPMPAAVAMAEHRPSASTTETVGSGCIADCFAGDVHEAPMSGHEMSTVCLAVLPLLLLGLLGRRRGWLARWQPLREGIGAQSRPRVGHLGLGSPSEELLHRLCVSRT